MKMKTETKTYSVNLKNRFPVAEGTLAFRFEKPQDFIFKSGQYIEMTLLDPSETDVEGNVRTFSIASAPEEDMLMVATRMRDSAFKREMAKMPLQTEILISAASGTLVLHKNPARTAVFLAGGIGVTPVRSILFHAARAHLPHRIVFFFANRSPEDAPFLDQLEALQKENPNFTFVPTMTHLKGSHREWKGATGKIDSVLLAKHMDGAQSPIFYVVGPPDMVNGSHKMLMDCGVDENDIRLEGFSGY